MKKRSSIDTALLRNHYPVVLFVVSSVFILGLLVYLVSLNTDFMSFAYGSSGNRLQALCKKFNFSQEACARLANHGKPSGSPELLSFCSAECSKKKHSMGKLCEDICVAVNSGKTCRGQCARFGKEVVTEQCNKICPNFLTFVPPATPSGTLAPTPTPTGTQNSKNMRDKAQQYYNRVGGH